MDFSEADRKVEEVDLIVSTLKTGLKDMIDAFGMYATELGLGEGEIRLRDKLLEWMIVHK